MAATIPGFRPVPRTGVIYVMHEAAKHGFSYGDPVWANLGQGSPETGAIPGSPPRVERITIEPPDQQYSPIHGNRALRQAVADYYNRTFRQGKASQYTAENVSIASGGRLALTRVAAALGPINMGHFIPDYTAYEELLSVFRAFIPIPILLDPEDGYRISPDALEKEILGRGLSALLISNPCNPTGQVVDGDELATWCDLARDTRCTLILDEFYSHYLYDGGGGEVGGNDRGEGGEGRQLSGAAYVEDVDRDPILVLDGLTKNWRYPGWRVSWTLGPRQVIEAIASAGSFLDGGANHPFQQATLPLLEPEHARQETCAIQRHFGRKRARTLERLRELGLIVEAEPRATFYTWVNLEALPVPLRNGMDFFREGLKERVITVPGVFFDVNPENRRAHARYQSYCRISFGPEPEVLERGLDAIERLIDRFS